MTPYERVLARSVPAEGGCLLWTGATGQKGYGQLSVGNKNKAVHRVVYEHVKGPIPAGMEIDHRCRVRLCVEIEHIEAVTHLENLRRKPKPTHCPQGHELTEANVKYLHRGTKRMCRRCWNDTRNAWRRRIRASKQGPEVEVSHD